MNLDDLDLENIIENSEKSFLKKRENGLMLSDNQINILKSRNIDYMKCTNIKDLIYVIDLYLEEIDDEEIENLVDNLSEINYYNYTNK